DSQYLLAECNRIDLGQIGLKGQISTYYSYGQLNPSYLNVNFTQVPSSVLTSNGSLQVFRWSERTPGQRQTNSVPVTMFFMQKGTGAVSNPNGSNVISKSMLEAIISQKALGTLGITVANFFERHFVVLTGMDQIWDAAAFVIYTNGTTGASGSVLLPAFYSNPNVYAQANASLDLQILHPNYAYRGSYASENDYFQLTEQICAGYFGSVRIPASEPEPEATGFFPKLMSILSQWIESFRSLFQSSLTHIRMGKASQ
ncbi:MAG: hypothetical protein AABZ31_00810, partial [Bdellovibrionota bacterium]